MSPEQMIRILFRVLLSTCVIAMMLATGFFAAVLSTKSKLQGPVTSAWTVGECLSAAILILMFIEFIASSVDNLEPLGYFAFQCIELLLWTIVALFGIGALIYEMPFWYSEPLFWIPAVALLLVLLLFVANFVNAFFLYRDQQVPGNGEATPLLGEDVWRDF